MTMNGVDVVVDDGVATFDFRERGTRGPGLAALIAAGGKPRKVTRGGPRPRYEVDEQAARRAGMLAEPVQALATDVRTSAGDATGIVQPTIPSSVNAHTQSQHHGKLRQREQQPTLGDQAAALAEPEQPVTWPEGEPNDDWRRDEIDDYALAHGLDTRDIRLKADALKAIQDAS